MGKDKWFRFCWGTFQNFGGGSGCFFFHGMFIPCCGGCLLSVVDQMELEKVEALKVVDEHIQDIQKQQTWEELQHCVSGIHTVWNPRDNAVYYTHDSGRQPKSSLLDLSRQNEFAKVYKECADIRNNIMQVCWN